MEDYPIELIMKITLNSAETYIEPSDFIGAMLNEVMHQRKNQVIYGENIKDYDADYWHSYALGQTNIIENLAYDLGMDKKKLKEKLKHHNDTLNNMYKNQLKRLK
tara:strand:+ start:267 stop:581 length:315 start_codon:yes stop_codon:yes gene_type:complete